MWSTTYDGPWELTLPPTKNCIQYWPKSKPVWTPDPPVLLPTILISQPICPLDISLLVNHWPNYLPLTTQQSRATGLPGGNHFHSSCKPFGNDGQPTTCMSYNNVTAGPGHHPTCSQVMSCWIERTTLHLSSGRQPSSQLFIQELTTKLVWSQSRPQGGNSNALFQKFVLSRSSTVSYRVIFFVGGGKMFLPRPNFVIWLISVICVIV
jgi:hypothetical protein